MPNVGKAKSHPKRSASLSGGLTREQVVTEATKLLRTEGLAAVSTRRVAERLNVKSPALYWHVRNKDELLQLVADGICAQMSLPPSGCGFRARLVQIATEYRRVLTGYRDAPRLFAEQPPTGPHRMRLYDAAVGAFLDAGFQTAEAIAMATFYRHYLLGMITEEVRVSGKGKKHAVFPAAALGVELQALGKNAGEYPNLAGAAKLLGQIQPGQLFMAGLKVILDGLEQRAKAVRRAKASRR